MFVECFGQAGRSADPEATGPSQQASLFPAPSLPLGVGEGGEEMPNEESGCRMECAIGNNCCEKRQSREEGRWTEQAVAGLLTLVAMEASRESK